MSYQTLLAILIFFNKIDISKVIKKNRNSYKLLKTLPKLFVIKLG